MKGAIAMKQLKRLLRKKGFTISEVLVAMMIFAIMTAIVMQILAIAINQHKKNVNSEKDMDKQVQDIVEYNSNMVKRETADMAISFVRTGSNKASGDGRLELNTIKANIDKDTTGDDDNKDNAGMVSEHDHIYGTKGITSVMVTETTAEKDDSTKTITLSVTVTDSKNVLMKAESNSLKVVIPDKNANPKVTINGSNMKYEPLSSTNYRFTALSKAASYSFTIKFDISNDDYASEYKSFAKYFIDHEYDGSDEATLRSATFKDSKDPGVYNQR
jgi:prepilin-type N-terminal cleavage/methylation domain-containing protein